MSDFVIPPDEFHVEVKKEGTLGLYDFDNKVAHHHFCQICGIYPFHQTLRMPGYYRINLGCVEGINTEILEVSVFDGKSL